MHDNRNDDRFEKIVVVTRRTRLQDLVERFNTQSQAKFYIEHAGGDFSDYVLEDDTYRSAREELLRSLPDGARGGGLKVQLIDRLLVPTYLFADHDLVVTVGQDGLVANCAKYTGRSPIVAVNPDPDRFDGILLPFAVRDAGRAVAACLRGTARIREVTLAEAALNNGQRMVAFNDLFIGIRNHTSARYRIEVNGASEPHSSSGIIVSTRIGSTGWLSSLFNMSAGISRFLGGTPVSPETSAWGDRDLLFVVREPFASKHSKASIVAGLVREGNEIRLESLMPTNGVIFSDGIEADYLAFNSGAIARIRAADQLARLVVGA